MGRRKFRLGRAHKRYEQKRQATKKNPIGRPPKRRKSTHHEENCTSIHSTPSSEPMDFTQEDLTSTTIESLRQTMILPSQWTQTTQESSATIQVCKISSMPASSSSQPIVTHSLTVNNDFTWTAVVHGHHVDGKTSQALANFSENLDSHSLNALLMQLDRCTVCPGHPDKHLVEMLSSMKGKLTSRHGDDIVASLDSYAPVVLNGEVYSQTVRYKSCEIIVNSAKCGHCVQYRDSLRKSFHRWEKKKKSSPSRRTATSSCTNFALLNTPEKLQRYRKLKSRSVATERKLKDAMEKLTRQHGVTLEPQMQDDLTSIMEEMSDEVRTMNPEQSFRRLFWEQQLQALNAKDLRQVRWHPALIKWCLHLKFKSSSAYHALRTTGVLTLPSERTLRDYTHWVKGEAGFQASVNCQLIEEANVKEEKDEYVALVFDEMKVREDLVFDKHSCRLVGFVNLGEINDTLNKFEKQCKDGEQPIITEDSVATHMLVFMIRGLFTNLEFVFTQFPTSGVTGDSLFPVVWEAIRNIEECGLKVIVVTADGASPNRKFFKMHQASKKSSEIVYKTPNPYSLDSRDIYFMSDVPHLIKTTRNCWSNSFSHANTRALWKNGRHISWTHLTDLYGKVNSTTGLTFLPKIKREHIHLNSYSRMRVNLAAQVLSSSVASALDYFGLDETQETQTFVKMFDRFFDCLNVRSMSESIHSRKPDLRPYRSPDDPRLKWLKEDFLGYLNEWEKSVEQRKGFTASQKAMMLLSRETIEGLRTTVHSFTEVVPLLLSVPGVSCVLSERFCQDPLESFFGKQRYKGGRNENPSVKEFLDNTVSLRVQGSAALEPLRGNCSRKRNAPMIVDSDPLPKRKRSKKH